MFVMPPLYPPAEGIQGVQLSATDLRLKKPVNT
jgi:hypothetical protein